MRKAEVARRLRALVLLVVGTPLAVTASAQRTGASIDAGALSMQYADSIDANALALTPSIWAESDLTSFSATGTLSQFSTGDWSGQGNADASLFTQKFGLFLGELQGTGGGSTRNDGSRTGQLLGIGRLHLAMSDKGVWIGAGAGGTWDGSTWRNVRQAEAAAWTKFGTMTAYASVTPVVVEDSIRYTDTQLSGLFNLPHVELSASGGFRNGSRLPTLGGTARSWGSASVTGWITSRLALVASAGTYPVDLTQGFPGGRFASLSLRLGSRRNMPIPTTLPYRDTLRTEPETVRHSPSGIVAFDVRNGASETRELRVNAPDAGTVELMGDFTGWTPVTLNSEGAGWWSVSLPITAGIHEINIRMNGGSWTTPPGLPEKSDEFGGTVGVLVIR